MNFIEGSAYGIPLIWKYVTEMFPLTCKKLELKSHCLVEYFAVVYYRYALDKGLRHSPTAKYRIGSYFSCWDVQ